MALDSTTVELRKDNIVIGVPIPVAIDVNDPSTIKVYAGSARVLVPPAEYILTLDNNSQNPKTWPTHFSITPYPALVNRADALKLETDAFNRIYIQRWLPLTTDFEDTDAFVRRKIEEEFDEVHMKLQQLHLDNELDGALLARALLVPENELGKVVPSIPRRAHRVFAYDANGVPIPSNLTLAQIEAGVNIINTPGYIVGSLTLRVPSEYPTLAAALLYLKDKYWASDATMTIEVTGRVVVADKYIAELNHSQGSSIRIVGASDPLEKTIMPTGWVIGVEDTIDNPNPTPEDPADDKALGRNVTLPLDNVTGVAVGDVVSLGYGSTQNRDNDLKWGYWADPVNGKGGGIHTIGTTVYIGEGVDHPAGPVVGVGIGTDTFIKPGVSPETKYLPMILVETGEIRAATSITDDFHFEISRPFAVDITNLLYWLWVPQAPGTISCAGGMTDDVVITGAGTDFASRCSVGDLVFSDPGGIARIILVNSDTSITVNQSKSIPAGTKFGIYAVHQHHRGAFEINAVDTVAKTVTYYNKHRSISLFAAPARNQVKGGTAKIYKNVLKTTHVEGVGIAANADTGWIDKLAWVGPKSPPPPAESGLTTATGCSWDEGDGYSSAHINFGPNTAFTEWTDGFRNWHGSFYAPELVLANHHGTTALWHYNGIAWLLRATIHGAHVTGVFQAVGSSMYATELYSIGHGSAGFYRIAGAFSGDGARSYGCTLGKYSLTGTSVHDVECWVICSRSVGSTWGFGGGGRASFNIILGNGGIGANFQNVSMQANSTITGGNDSDGVFGVDCSVVMTNAGSTNNKGSGVQGSVTARFSYHQGGVLHNHSYGISMLGSSRCRATSVIAENNSPFDYQVSGWGAQIDASLPKGTGTTYGQKRNHLIGGAIIIDTDPTLFPEIETITVVANATFVFDCPPILANNIQTHEIPVIGALARDAVTITRPNFTDTGISITGVVTAPDIVTVVFRNHTAASIDPASGTYGVLVQRAA